MSRSTVLVVDEDEWEREYLAGLIRICGYDILTVADGEEAVAALSTTSIDIVFTALNLSRLDGYGLIRWMHSREMAQPVLVLSNPAAPDKALGALRIGAYDYITRPYERDAIEAALRRADASVEYRRTEAELRQRTRELAALNAISVAANSVLEFDEMLDRALDAMIEALQLKGVIVFLAQEKPCTRLLLQRSRGRLSHALHLLPESVGPIGTGVALGEAQVEQLLGHVATDTWQGEEAIKAAVPLVMQGDSCGLLLLVGNAADAFQHNQLALLQATGNYLGIALTNARFYGQLRNVALDLEQQVEQRTRELQQSRDLLRTMFDGIPGGLALIDDQQQVLALNRAYAQLFGKSPAELVGIDYRQLWAGRGLDPTNNLIGRCLDENRSIFQRERMERNSQPGLVIDHYLFPVRDYTARPIQVIEYLEDVTERLALERVLAQNEQLAALGRLAATVAHEINTPLLAIRTCLGLISNPATPAPARKEYLSLAESELDRAAATIRGILDFYRSEGKERIATDINILVEQVLQLLRAEIERRSAAIQIVKAPFLPMIVVTPDQVKQVVLSLMMHALEYLGDDGSMVVRTTLQETGEMQQSYVVVQVESPGAGHNNSEPTDPFDALVTARADGNGLGLAVCQVIMREHEGNIDVEHLPQGGSRFTVSFPVNNRHRANPAQNQDADRYQPSLKGKV
jgi:PAS domain S-box-containing protein